MTGKAGVEAEALKGYTLISYKDNRQHPKLGTVRRKHSKQQKSVTCHQGGTFPKSSAKKRPKWGPWQGGWEGSSQ